jgi:hypothetical protein
VERNDKFAIGVLINIIFCPVPKFKTESVKYLGPYSNDEQFAINIHAQLAIENHTIEEVHVMWTS